MLKTGTYVEFTNPERTENLKGVILKVRKDIFGHFKRYEVLSVKGSYNVYAEELKQPDILPKLADVELATDELLSKALELSMGNPVDEAIGDMWKYTVEQVNQDRHSFNRRYLYEVLGSKEFKKFNNATLK